MGLLALPWRDCSQSNKSQCEKIFPDFSYLTNLLKKKEVFFIISAKRKTYVS